MRKIITVILIVASFGLVSCNNGESKKSSKTKYSAFEEIWGDFQEAVKADDIDKIKGITLEANQSNVVTAYKELVNDEIKSDILKTTVSDLKSSGDKWKKYAFKIMRTDNFNPEFHADHYLILVSFNLRDGKWYLMSVEQTG